MQNHHNSIKKRLFAISLALCCSSCAVSYQPDGLTGGYRDSLEAPGQYAVSYHGNGSIRLEQAVDFAILRAALIAKQQQQAHFQLTVTQVKVVQSPSGTMGVTIQTPTVRLLMKIPPAIGGAAQPVAPKVPCLSALTELYLLTATRAPVVQLGTTDCIQRIQSQYQLSDAQLNPQ